MVHWKLKTRISEKYGSQRNFCVDYGISEVALTAKIRGKAPFKSTEIVKMSKCLDIPKDEITDYFFAFDVK